MMKTVNPWRDGGPRRADKGLSPADRGPTLDPTPRWRVAPARPGRCTHPQEQSVLNPYAAMIVLVSFAKERLQREEKGATAVEYGLMVGLIAAVIVGTVLLLGGQLDDLFTKVTDAITKAGRPPERPSSQKYFN